MPAYTVTFVRCFTWKAGGTSHSCEPYTIIDFWIRVLEKVLGISSRVSKENKQDKLSQQLLFHHVQNKETAQCGTLNSLQIQSVIATTSVSFNYSALIHFDLFESKLHQNILFQLSCVMCSLRRAPVQNKS